MKLNQHTGMLSVYRPPLVYELTIKSFTLVFDDGYDRLLTFKTTKHFPSVWRARKKNTPTTV